MNEDDLSFDAEDMSLMSDWVSRLQAELAAERARTDTLVLAVTHQPISNTGWSPELATAMRAILEARK